MKDLVFVSGHKNPDTDSICAAIGYAELKRRRGVSAIPVRLGEVNRETRFVLDFFEVPEPLLLETVKRQVYDLEYDQVPAVSPHITVKTAWHLMRTHNVKVLPVVDDAEQLVGVVTLSNITQRFMDAMEESTLAAGQTSLDDIASTINGQVLVGGKAFRSTGRIQVAASSMGDLKTMLEPGDIQIGRAHV
jgi:manganese-dependent inorganic pyrophosphatase